MADSVVGVPGIFSSLKDEGPETETIPGITAVHYLVLCKPVPFGFVVSCPDATVIAVIFAIICEFDKSPEIDLVAVVFNGPFPGQLEQVLPVFRIVVSVGQHVNQFFSVQFLLRIQFPD